jgi:hypothetical protein
MGRDVKKPKTKHRLLASELGRVGCPIFIPSVNGDEHVIKYESQGSFTLRVDSEERGMLS